MKNLESYVEQMINDNKENKELEAFFVGAVRSEEEGKQVLISTNFPDQYAAMMVVAILKQKPNVARHVQEILEGYTFDKNQGKPKEDDEFTEFQTPTAKA